METLDRPAVTVVVLTLALEFKRAKQALKAIFPVQAQFDNTSG